MTTKKFVGFAVLKRAVSISQVLSRYGLMDHLSRSGNSLVGVCPLHAGHNRGQFRVSLSKDCWMCFGDCNAGGSIVDFVSRKEGIGIRDAALLIQDWFNVQPIGNGHSGGNGGKPPGTASRAAPEPPDGHNKPLRFVLEDLDREHPYLSERGLSKETIETFGVGFCKRGSLAGLIAIPIHNSTGQLVAYAGRWPGEPPERTPKYRLPKGFRKSLELFNLNRVIQTESNEPLVVVEGFFGCMTVWEAGHRRVVSSMGSRLSQTQEELIIKAVGPTGQVLLCFDEDAAGRKGRAEARERLARLVNVSIVKFDVEGTQPDQLPPGELLKLLEET
jgi:DNA primase